MSANAAECPPANAPVSVRRRKMQARGRMVPGQEFNAMSQGDRHKRAVPLSGT
jgi:hypothetical protein